MIRISARAGIGYGDQILPLNWAHHVANILEEEVEITFLWQYDSYWKYNKNTPEYLFDQTDYIQSIMKPPHIGSVIVTHKFNDNSSIKYIGYSPSVMKEFPMHASWPYIDEITSRNREKLIVVNDSLNNMEDIKKTYKNGEVMWKDSSDWHKNLRNLNRIKKNYNIVRIDYNTPLLKVVDLISRSSLYIGYHGGIAWIAHAIRTSGLILSNVNRITINSFNGFAHHRNIPNDNIINIINNSNFIMENHKTRSITIPRDYIIQILKNTHYGWRRF